MKILGIVPARKGSKRVVGKNMRDLCGKPLCAWAIEAAMHARGIDRLVVSSDDERVLEVAAKYDRSFPLARPAALAEDTSPAVDYVFHALRTLEENGEGAFDAVCITPASSPLTLSEDIDGTIALFKETGAETAVSVMHIDHAIHPVKMKTMQGNRLVPYLEEENGRMAAEELPEIFVRNCAVYVSRRDVFATYRSAVGKDQRGYVMPPERSIDINVEMDLLLAELLMKRSGRG